MFGGAARVPCSYSNTGEEERPKEGYRQPFPDWGIEEEEGGVVEVGDQVRGRFVTWKIGRTTYGLQPSNRCQQPPQQQQQNQRQPLKQQQLGFRECREVAVLQLEALAKTL